MTATARKYSTLALYSRLILQARPYWSRVCGYLVLSLLATPLALLIPLPLKIAIDHVLGEPMAWWVQRVLPGGASGGAVLAFVAIMVVIVAVLTQAHHLATTMLKIYLNERLVTGFRSRLFRHVQNLSLAYHDRQGTSDSNYRIQYDAASIQHVVVEGVIPLVSSAVMLAAMLYVTARLSPKLALVAVVICPPLLVLTATFRRRLLRRLRVEPAAVRSGASPTRARGRLRGGSSPSVVRR